MQLYMYRITYKDNLCGEDLTRISTQNEYWKRQLKLLVDIVVFVDVHSTIKRINFYIKV